jgi:hypothetical protein
LRRACPPDHPRQASTDAAVFANFSKHFIGAGPVRGPSKKLINSIKKIMLAPFDLWVKVLSV